VEFFGINGSEFIVLLVVAAVVLGPERLPRYAQQLARLVRELRRMAQGASAQMRDELGPEFDDIDWRKLDPRQYDPRRIVREALSDSSVDPDDPLGLRGAGIDRQSLGLTREDVGLDRNGMKPVSRGGPGERQAAGAHPAENGAAAATADEIPLDPDAT
jgi:sec-independent protein translocase protein TatB